MNCEFYFAVEDLLSTHDSYYTCEIVTTDIPRRVNSEYLTGIHLFDGKNDYVVHFHVKEKVFIYKRIPFGLGEFFKNLSYITINYCNIESLYVEELKQFPHLLTLDLSHNKIEELSGNLFQFNRKLFDITLSYNKLRKIAPTVFDGLQQLIAVDLTKNVSYDCFFDIDKPDSMTLKELIEKLKSKWIKNEQSRKMLQTIPIKEDQNQCSINLHHDLENFLLLDEFKDFNIKVGERNFKVHKILLVARSETIAEIIRTIPDIDELVLEDVSTETFEMILEYFYKDEMPKDSTKAREIFVAATKLRTQSLKEAAVEILIKDMCDKKDLQLSEENFNLGIKFGSDRLKKEAFGEIKNHFPDKKLSDDLLKQPEKLKKIIEAKRLVDEANRQLEEQLNELC